MKHFKIKKGLTALALFVTLVGAIGQPLNAATAAVETVWAKEVVVYITNTGKKYHKGTCHHLKKSKIEIKKNKAKERGYTPCGVCKP